MIHDFSDFRPPTLHLVVAEDKLAWQERLRDFFASQAKQWSFCRTGQFRFECDCCGSYEEFTETTDGLLRGGNLVYATVDLFMPRYKRETVVDDEVWKETILWCLDRVRTPSTGGDKLEFCVISEQEKILTGLFEHPRHGAELRRKGIKRAFKDQIANDPDVALLKIWDDVRTFVLRNIQSCTIPAAEPGANQSIVWFGGHEALFRLLERTDEITKREHQSEFYMAFADACGFEEDWFRLCCHLKGIENPHIHPLGELTRRDDAWRRDLHHPPAALLLSQIKGSHDRGHNVHERMEDARFFEALDKSGGFACFQFPELNSDFDADGLLDLKERKVLEACFGKIYEQREPFGQRGPSHYRDSDHIVRFPDYETLKAAGVLRAAIAFNTKECQAKYSLDGIPIDPEVAEILGEIPWNDPRAYGLDGLRTAIDVAYENASSRKTELGRYVDLRFFPQDPVKDHFGSGRGFVIRARRLVRLLDYDWTGGWSTKPAAEMSYEKQFRAALAGLVQIHDLFEALQRLMDLAKQLPESERQFSDEFPLADFEALKAAHEFLLSIFRSPEALQQRIDGFRRYENDRNWRDNYPSLETREDWSEVIQHVRFTWPYRKFRLPTPVDDYLQASGVIADIYREMENVLPRHPDLQSQWQHLERERRLLEEDLQEREVQRREARRYARESHSQPVLLLLGSRADEVKVKFTDLLQSFLFFNASLAVCENVHRFDGGFCNRKHGIQFLERAELGNAIQILRNYRSGLINAGRLSESILRRWIDRWPQSGRQHDTTRLIARIAGGTMTDTKFSKRMSVDQRALARRLSNLAETPDHCPIEDVLTLFGMVRNMFDKKYTPRFWTEHIEDIWDALRGFVAATTGPEFRFGYVAEDGSRVLLWSRNSLQEGDQGPHLPQFSGRLCAFDRQPSDGDSICFPIDDLIRLNPENCSPFAFWAGEKWVDLTSDQGDFAVESAFEWLPKRSNREKSAVWRWAYERVG